MTAQITGNDDIAKIGVLYDGVPMPGFGDSIFTLESYEFQTWGDPNNMFAVMNIQAPIGWHTVKLFAVTVFSDTMNSIRRIHITKEPREDTVFLSKGWNIVSPLLRSVPAGFTRFEPDGIQESAFYSFGGTYHTADSLFPDKGYWLKTNAPGILILGYSQNRVQRMRPMNLPQPPGAE